MNLLRRSVVTLGALCLAVGAGAAAPAPRTAAPTAGRPAANKPGASPLAPAIAALQKEYQTSLKEKKGVLPREKCDYFATAEKPEGLTAEVILATLEKPLTGPGAG